jgi:phage terminase large subunit-like protein
MKIDFDITKEDIQAEIQRRRYNKFERHFTGELSIDKYPKHKKFIDNTNIYRESCMLAANRVGKSETGAYAMTCWLTGIYPDWWQGKRFKKPITAIAAGETAKLVRDSIQAKLLGEITALGTGFIPKDKIRSKSTRAGVPDAIDTVRIEHISGMSSVLRFMSYDQGREAFQAMGLDVIWLDEEPPQSLYDECLLRTMTTNGIVISTFTPLKGITETVLSLQEKQSKDLIGMVNATWDDAPHLTQKAKDELFAALPPFQRDARSKGIPALGAGSVYPVSDEELLIDPFKIPIHWRKAYGMDVGWNNTAVCWIAHDPDTDVIYVIEDYKKGQVEPAVHASAIKAKGNIPGFIDPASAGSNQKDGEKLIELYKAQGLNLRPADNTVEAGIFDIYERMTTGRLKIFRNCQELITEKRLYRRDEKGKIFKQNDHILDALRYVVRSGLQYAVAGDAKEQPKPSFKRHIRGGWASK